MNHKTAEQFILHLLDGTLSTSNEERLNAHLAQCARCTATLKQHRMLQDMEARIARDEPELPAGFAGEVIRAVRRSSPAPRERRSLPSWLRWQLVAPAATLAVASVALVLTRSEVTELQDDLRTLVRQSDESPDATAAEPRSSAAPADAVQVLVPRVVIEPGQRLEESMFEVRSYDPATVPADSLKSEDAQALFSSYARARIEPGVTVSKQAVSEEQPAAGKLAAVPPGHRPVTISTDSSFGLEGRAAPGSRVDIVMTRTEADGTKSSSVVAENATILSAGGSAQTDNVTVAIPPSDALRVQMAQQMGQVALVLRSPKDISTGVSPSEQWQDAARPPAPTERDGLVRYTDEGGRFREYELSGTRWRKVDNDGTQSSAVDAAPSQQQVARAPAPEIRADDLLPQTPAGSAVAGADRREPPSTVAAEGPTSLTLDLSPQVNASTNGANRYRRYVAPPRHAPVSGERYGHYEENPRLSVEAAPLSTFSADVDTGSFTNVRRFLSSGQLPPPDAVRIEELINYFDYDAQYRFDGPFGIHYELGRSPLESGKHLLRISVTTRGGEEPAQNSGWNLIFLIDVSGSMADANKLGLLKRSLKVLVDQMRPQDRLGIVTYSNGAQVALYPTSGSDKTQILRILDSLRAAGGTNGSAGIDLAYQIAQHYRSDSGVNRVILCTDGDFNAGTYDFSGLMRLIEEHRRSGVTLTTIGVGAGNYNELNLEQLANRGNGNYFYLDSFAEAQRVFETGLAATVQTVAKDVKLQVEFNPAYVREYRLIGYDNRKLPDAAFHDSQADAGEIGGGHTVTALYELILQGSSPLPLPPPEVLRYGKRGSLDAAPLPRPVAPPVMGEVAYLKIRYKEPTSDTARQIERPLAWSEDASDEPSSELRFLAAVSYFGHILRRSAYAGPYSLHEVIELAKTARGADPAGKRSEVIQLMRQAATLHH